MSRPAITPSMKVGALLEHYPELEERLIALAPAFEKLRNPVLRKTVAKVATLEQAARIGGVTVASLVAALRGEREDTVAEDSRAAAATNESLVSEGDVIDLDAHLESGVHPLGQVLDRVRGLQPGETLEIVASFRPEPLLEHLGREAVQVGESKTADGRFLLRLGRPRHGSATRAAPADGDLP